MRNTPIKGVFGFESERLRQALDGVRESGLNDQLGKLTAGLIPSSVGSNPTPIATVGLGIGRPICFENKRTG